MGSHVLSSGSSHPFHFTSRLAFRFLSLIRTSLPFASSGSVNLAFICVISSVIPLVFFNELVTFKVSDGLPCVVIRILPSLPFHQVLGFTFPEALRNDGLNFVFLWLRHGELLCWKISCRSESSNKSL